MIRPSTTALGRRPRILDREVIDRLIDAAEAGLSTEASADYAGIGRSTLFAWLNRGRDAERIEAAGEVVEPSEQPFLDLLDRTARIRAERAVDALATIEKAAESGQWRAAAWFLERAYPENWSRMRRELPTPPVEPAQPVDIEALEAKFSRFFDEN